MNIEKTLQKGMKEFITHMIAHLFPEEKEYEDPFEEAKENNSKVK